MPPAFIKFSAVIVYAPVLILFDAPVYGTKLPPEVALSIRSAKLLLEKIVLIVLVLILPL